MFRLCAGFRMPGMDRGVHALFGGRRPKSAKGTKSAGRKKTSIVVNRNCFQSFLVKDDRPLLRLHGVRQFKFLKMGRWKAFHILARKLRNVSIRDNMYADQDRNRLWTIFASSYRTSRLGYPRSGLIFAQRFSAWGHVSGLGRDVDWSPLCGTIVLKSPKKRRANPKFKLKTTKQAANRRIDVASNAPNRCRL